MANKTKKNNKNIVKQNIVNKNIVNKNIVNKNIVNKNKTNNNKGNTTKKTKKHLQHCSPHINSTGVSCFDKEALHKITKLWNKSHTDKITIGRKSNKTLWKEINNKMHAITLIARII